MKLKSKRLRLRSEKPRIGLIIGAVALALVLVLVVLGMVQCSKDQKEAELKAKEIQYITVAFKPNKTTYYIGETFDPAGLKVQVVTNSQEYTHFVDWTQLSFEGFDSSVPNEKLTVTVSYEGYSTILDVVIKEVESSQSKLEKIEIYDFQTTYTLKKWNMGGPNTNGAKIRAIYSDGSVVEGIVLKDIYIPGYEQLDAPGTTEITVQYSDSVTTVETTVTITVTE